MKRKTRQQDKFDEENKLKVNRVNFPKASELSSVAHFTAKSFDSTNCRTQPNSCRICLSEKCKEGRLAEENLRSFEINRDDRGTEKKPQEIS